MQAFNQHYIQPYYIERQDEAPEVGVQLPTWQETQHTTGQPMEGEASGGQVGGQSGGYVGGQVCGHVGGQVCGQSGGQVCGQFGGQSGG